MSAATSSEATRPRASGAIGLRPRVYLLMATGVAFPLLVAGIVGSYWLQLTEARLHAAWISAAQAVAADLDSKVTSDLRVLQQLAATTRGQLSRPAAPDEQRAVQRAMEQLQHRAPVFLLDDRGYVVAEALAGTGASIPMAALDDIADALGDGRPHLSRLIQQGHGHALYESVPFRSYAGEILGVAVSRIDPSTRDFATLLGILQRGESSSVALIDDRGTIIAATEEGRIGRTIRCSVHFGEQVKTKGTEGGRCRSCHGGRDETGDELVASEVYAFAPLASAPWGVLVRQESREALPFDAGVPWVVLGAILYAFMVVAFSWGAARSVTLPVSVLTREAERLSAGDLSREIPDLGEDEIGRLGQALEKMRTSLRELILRVANQNAILEERVEERTHALAEVNDRLREREAMRGELLRKVITAQEDERKRLARELHDETSQSLAALAMGIDAAAEAIRGGGQPRLDEVKGIARRTLEDVHRLILDLRPSMLDDLGLVSAIEWYADRALRGRGVSVRCECDEGAARISPETETALFRICQEALSNVARHAEASGVLVELGMEQDQLRLSIEDDGRGFDSAAPVSEEDRKHWGILGIKERAEILGGTATIESAAGKGTRVEVRIPVQHLVETK
ncbi:MAG: histidine kinase [Anaeromyxobacteraceae bacterium]